MKNYKIDEVSKLSGLTKRTIRYYEELGLLSPPERTDGGMRLYTQEHIDRLGQIVNARDVLGFSLQEILEFVKIREEISSQSHVYRTSVDAEEKRRQLVEVEKNVAIQLRLIDQKLEKMTQFRAEIGQIHRRICDAIENTPQN
ncbi:MerR family transcriptional regulator [Paenibacillus kobensis]|uniref:MerR family transcriptional regulator n=1 Tax=Paenibacillus kobensis TaxID=59841 RepID=UPI000FD7FAE3|nr:MerR family transcriptional regulator [Paenibacillus kobensis]